MINALIILHYNVQHVSITTRQVNNGPWVVKFITAIRRQFFVTKEIKKRINYA